MAGLTAGATPRPSGASRAMLAVAAAIAFLAVCIRLWVSYRTHSVGEDALITLRYAENLAAGRGWCYNPGERVLGTTTPLFTLLLAAGCVLRPTALSAGIGISILADGITCFLIARLFARPELGRPKAGLFAAAMYAVSSTPISISISGMETALVTCVGMAAVHACIAGRSRELCLLGAALFLLRIDGLLLFGLLLASHVVRSRRAPWPDVLLFLAMAIPWTLFATYYFGSPVPESVVAKLAVYSGRAWEPGAFAGNAEAFQSQFLLGWPQRIITCAFLLGAMTIAVDVAFRVSSRRRNSAAPSSLLAWISDQQSHRANSTDPTGEADTKPVSVSRVVANPDFAVLLAPLLWVLIYYAAMLVSHVPAFPWYFLPPWPLFLSIAVLAMDGILHAISNRRTSSSKIVDSPKSTRALTNHSPPHPLTPSPPHPKAWTLALAVLIAAGLWHVRSVEHDIAAAQALEDTVRRPIGEWLRRHAEKSDRVLLEPIGYIGYYSEMRVLDMIGLVSPEVLPFYRTSEPLRGIVSQLRPEWMCLRLRERDLLESGGTNLLTSDYDLIKEFPTASEPAFYVYKRRNARMRSVEN